MEHTALPYVDASLWSYPLLFGGTQVVAYLTRIVYGNVYRWYSCTHIDYPHHLVGISLAKGIYWFATYRQCQATDNTLYIYPYLLWFLGILRARNSQDAYIYAIGGDRGDGRVVGSYHHQPLVENLSTSHGYRRTIRRHMQLCAQLFHPTFDTDNHSITTIAITNVCTHIPPGTYPYASGMWIPVGVVVYVHSYTHYDVCVDISFPYYS